jgi:hypothetical protein
MKLNGTMAAALTAALVLGSVAISPADARSRHHNRNNAVAAGAMIGLFGGLLAATAADNHRHRYYYDDGHRYDRGYNGPYYRGYRGHSGTYVDPNFRYNAPPDAR